MPKRRDIADLPSLGTLDRDGNLVLQLAQALRAAIASGALRPGERLPSTRALASSLGLARGTVMAAFDQLGAEGYLESKVGAGTRIASALQPDYPLGRTKDQAPRPAAADATVPGAGGGAGDGETGPRLPASVARYTAIGRSLAPLPQVPFAIAVPTGDAAPDDHWRRIGNRVRGSRAAAPATYGDPRGVPALRTAIADYARKARAVACTPDRVIVTAGTQQGLYLAARILLEPGDTAWAEDPAYPGLTAAIGEFDIGIARVPVDAQGLDVALGVAACPHARAAFVTPSHQYPLGMPMSMARRTALLAWARRHGAWIVEDDYDSELRYAGHPFPSLQGLDPDRVIYLGTFSKVLFPSLRLGYAIVPEPLAEAFAAARWIMDRQSPAAEQHVLAAYMAEGHFEAHIRRIRAVYAAQRQILLDAVGQRLSPWLTVQPSDQGMHVLALLHPGLDDVALADRALTAGVALRPISPTYAGPGKRHGFMLGFGGFTREALLAGVERLRDVLAEASPDDARAARASGTPSSDTPGTPSSGTPAPGDLV